MNHLTRFEKFRPLNEYPNDDDDDDVFDYLPEYEKQAIEEAKRVHIVSDPRNIRISDPGRWQAYIKRLEERRNGLQCSKEKGEMLGEEI